MVACTLGTQLLLLTRRPDWYSQHRTLFVSPLVVARLVLQLPGYLVMCLQRMTNQLGNSGGAVAALAAASGGVAAEEACDATSVLSFAKLVALSSCVASQGYRVLLSCQPMELELPGIFLSAAAYVVVRKPVRV